LVLLAGCAPTQQEVKKPPEIELYWPAPPQVPRIKWVTAYHSSLNLGTGNELMRFLGEEQVITLVRPHGVVADREGNIYVTDIGFGRLVIFKFDLQHKKLKVLGKTGPVKVKIPLGLAIDNDRGLLFVADNGSKAVYAIDKDSGNIKFAIGQEPGTFKNPASVAVDPKRQRVYVGDSKLQVIKAFSYDGKLIWTIGEGKRSNKDTGFNVPSQLALDSKGNLYVADMFNRYVKVFSPDGKFLKKIGYGIGLTSGHFSKLTGVALDTDDHIYALDTDVCNFQIFDQDNRLLLHVGEPGYPPGKFLTPTNIYIDEQNRIYVTDTFNHRVQVFQYLTEEEGKKILESKKIGQG